MFKDFRIIAGSSIKHLVFIPHRPSGYGNGFVFYLFGSTGPVFFSNFIYSKQNRITNPFGCYEESHFIFTGDMVQIRIGRHPDMAFTGLESG